jgi:Asp-tRNA(Asn)/Glu-tRNA(Gln) amidotransferase C subunit
MEIIFPSFAELETKVKEAAVEIKRLRTTGVSKLTDETKATMKERIEKIIKLIEEVE